MNTLRALAAVLGLALAVPAAARDYCPDRPGLDTPPCTLDPGRVSAEVSLLDWTRDNPADTRTDTILAGDLAVRAGIAQHAELRLAWPPWGHVRVHDKASGAIDTQSGTGDVRLGLKRNLVSPDGGGFSLALLPSVSLPTGGMAIGAGDWGAGLQVPASLALTPSLSLVMTPEFDAAVNQRRSGRHLAWGSAAGLAVAAAKGLNLAFEAAVLHDDDPAGASTSATAGVAAGLMLGENFQADVSGTFGLNAATPGLRLAFGIARRF
jgi:hypothetical protein